MKRRKSKGIIGDLWAKLTTESVNSRSLTLDAMSPERVARVITSEDIRALRAVRRASGEIAKAARIFAGSIVSGGNAIYVGAGTSGRLGVADAAELPPTFGLPKSGKGSAIGVIAGGRRALVRSVEGAEDDGNAGRSAMQRAGAGKGDIVIGISASSLAPYVRSALQFAKSARASTVLVTMNRIAKPSFVDVLISVPVGPEVVTGSTRMKAGLATKAILHAMSTSAMVLAGKVYGNRMVDLRCWSDKLVARGERLIMEIGGVPRATSRTLLKKTGGNVKPAIVMARAGMDFRAAKAALKRHRGSLRDVLSSSASR